MNTTDVIWANGEFVPWEDAKVHVLTHALHYGTGVFEGIRAYETDQGPAVFRHREHLERLEKSARLYYMEIPYSVDELREATHELIARSGLRSCYIRPLVVRGYGPIELPSKYPVDAVRTILFVESAAAFDDLPRKGVREGIGTWAGYFRAASSCRQCTCSRSAARRRTASASSTVSSSATAVGTGTGSESMKTCTTYRCSASASRGTAISLTRSTSHGRTRSIPDTLAQVSSALLAT